MGTTSHHTIVVSGCKEDVKKAIKKAKIIFTKHLESDKLISECIVSSNCTNSFFIAPDGSKEGWNTSNSGDNAREDFINYLNKKKIHLDYIMVEFGGDYCKNRILEANR